MCCTLFFKFSSPIGWLLAQLKSQPMREEVFKKRTATHFTLLLDLTLAYLSQVLLKKYMPTEVNMADCS